MVIRRHAHNATGNSIAVMKCFPFDNALGICPGKSIDFLFKFFQHCPLRLFQIYQHQHAPFQQF